LEQASPANHHASTWQLSFSGWFDSVFWLLDRLIFCQRGFLQLI
jgi:hypothetical protein